MDAKTLAKTLYSRRFHYKDEKDLQRGIAQVLSENDLVFEAEVSLTKRDRIDFLVGDIGLEVKASDAGGGVSQAAVIRQLFRYAALPEINHLILVTDRSKHQNLPPDLNGKPLYIVWLGPSFL